MGFRQTVTGPTFSYDHCVVFIRELESEIHHLALYRQHIYTEDTQYKLHIEMSQLAGYNPGPFCFEVPILISDYQN